MKNVIFSLASSVVMLAGAESAQAMNWQDCVQYDLATLDRVEKLALSKDDVLLKGFKPNQEKTLNNTISLATPLFHNDEEQLAQAGEYYGSSRFLTRYRAMQKAQSCEALAAEFGTSHSISLMTIRQKSCLAFDLDRGFKPYKGSCDHKTTKSSSSKNKDKFFDEVIELTGRLRTEIQGYKAYKIPDDAQSVSQQPLKFLPKDCVAADLQVLAELEARALSHDRTLLEQPKTSWQYSPQHHYLLIAAELKDQFEYDKKYYRDSSFQIMTKYASCDEYRKYRIERGSSFGETCLLPEAKYHPIERHGKNVDEQKIFSSMLKFIAVLRSRLAEVK